MGKKAKKQMRHQPPEHYKPTFHGNRPLFTDDQIRAERVRERLRQKLQAREVSASHQDLAPTQSNPESNNQVPLVSETPEHRSQVVGPVIPQDDLSKTNRERWAHQLLANANAPHKVELPQTEKARQARSVHEHNMLQHSQSAHSAMQPNAFEPQLRVDAKPRFEKESTDMLNRQRDDLAKSFTAWVTKIRTLESAYKEAEKDNHSTFYFYSAWGKDTSRLEDIKFLQSLVETFKGHFNKDPQSYDDFKKDIHELELASKVLIGAMVMIHHKINSTRSALYQVLGAHVEDINPEQQVDNLKTLSAYLKTLAYEIVQGNEVALELGKSKTLDGLQKDISEQLTNLNEEIQTLRQ